MTSGGMSRLAVVKVGGGLMRQIGLERAARAVSDAVRDQAVVIVPGGGTLADAVRALDREASLSPDASHWMAILAMDQQAHALADKITGAQVVFDGDGIRVAHAEGRLPVLAPFRWMYAADVLPHSWDATSDSVAAFVAGALDAALLVLLKPAAGDPLGLVDATFASVLPAGLRVVALGPGELGRLSQVLES
jgi:aspartokinase-like uncharacterized kinase